MKLTLHKVLVEPFEYPDFVNEDGSSVYCVLYLTECNGEVEETEMLYETFNEAYEEAKKVQSTIEGVVVEDNSMYDA